MIQLYTLENGLRVVMEPLPFVRSISFGIWVKNGSRDEISTESGISHFIEHMLFKGTQKRSAKQIADDMDAVGGQINAFTAKEHTCYYARTLDTHFDTMLDVLSDMFFNSRFDESDVQKECNVILEEYNMYEDTPEDLVHDLLQKQIWLNDSLGQSILGTPDTISSFSKDNMQQYVSNHYRPENTVIAVAGNINEQEVLEKIRKTFNSFAKAGHPTDNMQNTVYTPAFITREKDIEQVHLCVGFPGVPSGSDDTYTLAVINTIFGGGMSSRLFQKIREEQGLVYSVYSYNASYIGAGVFTIYAALNPTQVYDVMKLIVEEIKGLFTNRVTADQLTRTKEQLKSNYLLSLESAANRMNSIGRTMLMLDKIITADELIEKIDAVSMDYFYEICTRIFKLDQMSISLVGKTEGMEKDELFS